jgi:hypothetical protein
MDAFPAKKGKRSGTPPTATLSLRYDSADSESGLEDVPVRNRIVFCCSLTFP